MAASNERIVTVFGGTGFLGRRVVRHLRCHGFSVRIACRHPDRSRERRQPIGITGRCRDELAAA